MEQQQTTTPPHLTTRPETHLIGLQYAGPVHTLGTEIPKLWSALWDRVGEIPRVVDGQVGWSPCIDAGDTHTIFVGVQVEGFTRIPAGMFALTLPEQHYATLTYQGPLNGTGIHDAYVSIYNWLGEQNLQTHSIFHTVERYPERATSNKQAPDSAENTFEINIPVVKK
ncbi:MAG TPA: effector binding domain-containing protein [Bacilli bacterium]|nr:effector binding domain-containing protein [Bacilli bacterium]